MPRPAPTGKVARPEPGRRGGPRPGSGPPRGNLNALKHGRTSKQHKRLLQLIAQDPEARRLLMEIARRNRRRQEQAEREASQLLDDVARRLRERALDEAIALYENNQRMPPPADMRRSFNAAFSRKTTNHPT